MSYRKSIPLLLLLCTNVFGNPCDEERLTETLISMKLNTSIRTNADLLKALHNRFGKEFVDYLTHQHAVILNAPDEDIDEKTLEWMIKNFETAPHKQVVFAFFPSSIDQPLKIEHVLTILSAEIKTRFIRYAMMVSKYSEYKYISDYLLNKNNEKDIKEILKGLFFKDSEQEIHKSYKKLVDIYSIMNNYHFEGNDFNITNPKIHIFSHSDAGEDFLFGGNSYSPIDVAERLLDFAPPIPTTIKIQSCMAACEKSWSGYDKETLKKMFLSGQIHEFIATSQDSLLKRFANAYHFLEPGFKGELSGYMGYVNVKAGTAMNKYGETVNNVHRVYIGAYAADGTKEYINVRRSDARVTLSF